MFIELVGIEVILLSIEGRCLVEEFSFWFLIKVNNKYYSYLNY